MTIKVLSGDCRDLLKTLPEASVDAVLIDPPYGLEFMGKEWDGPKGFRRSDNEADVSRDNVFGRTSAKAPEFQPPGWQGGGGFSKPGIGERETAWPSFSANSRFGTANPTCGTCGGRLRGKKKCECAEPAWQPIGKRRNAENEGLPNDMTGGGMSGHMRLYQSWCEEWARELYRVMKPGAHMLAFGGTRTYHRMACAVEDAGFEIRDQFAWAYGSGFPKSRNASKAIDKELGADRELVGIGRGKGGQNLNQVARPTGSDADDARGIGAYGVGATQNDVDIPITKAATPEAAAWEGFGTAVKPAWEPLVLARKPMIGSLAKNLLKHGCGALNIDGCRIPTDPTVDDARLGGNGAWKTDKMAANVYEGGYAGIEIGSSSLGRWPANLAHDGSDEVLAAFEVAGERSSGHTPAVRGVGGISTSGHRGQANLQERFGNSGSAARFFYSPKADRADRADSKHPTVKPVDLIRHYARMITPPGGTLLDCFAGSGTTGEAAMLEGFDCILIERDEQSVKDIQHRIKRWSGGDAPLFAELDATPPEPDLFDGS